MSIIKTIFWRGVKATLPLLITFAVVIWVFSIVEAFFGAVVKEIFGTKYYFTGLGSILGVIMIFYIGVIINLWLVQGLYNWGDQLVKRIPVIKTIYKALEDLMSFFDPARKGQSGSPVLIDTPLGKAVAFVTADANALPEGQEFLDGKVAVYIPLSYQIGGVTVFLNKDQVIPLNMPVDKAMSFVLTAGMTGQRE